MTPENLFQDNLKTAKPRETSKNQGLSRAWIRCPSGRRLDLLNPSAVDVEIDDIALSLSRISRWAGMTDTPYGFSVAQHCVLVVRLMEWIIKSSKSYRNKISESSLSEKQWLLAGLCHDGAEAYLGGDLCGPAKAALGKDGYKAIESKLEEAIHIRMGLPAVLPVELKKLIKEADRASAYAEAILIAGFTEKEAEPLFGVKTPLKKDAKMETMPPAKAEKAFLDTLAELV